MNEFPAKYAARYFKMMQEFNEDKREAESRGVVIDGSNLMYHRVKFAELRDEMQADGYDIRTLTNPGETRTADTSDDLKLKAEALRIKMSM